MSRQPYEFIPGEIVIANLGFGQFAFARINEICGSQINVTIETVDQDGKLTPNMYNSIDEARDFGPDLSNLESDSNEAVRVISHLNLICIRENT